MTLKEEMQRDIRRSLTGVITQVVIIGFIVAVNLATGYNPGWWYAGIFSYPVILIIIHLHRAYVLRKILHDPLFYLLAIRHEFGGKAS